MDGMKKVFLDIGAHLGETLSEIRKEQYGFDRIVCFEPSPRCRAALKALALDDDRVEIYEFGLSDVDATADLMRSGSLSATIVPNKNDSIIVGEVSDIVNIRSAAQWVIHNIKEDDLVVAKLNCEGAEVFILNNLLDHGLLFVFYNIMIAFDVRDYPDLRHEELRVRSRLRMSGLSNFCFSDDVMIGKDHAQRIRHWLSNFGMDKPKFLADVSEYRMLYSSSLVKYSKKSGRFYRIESHIKHALGYEQRFPTFLKILLRKFKYAMGLSRERPL